MQLKPCICEQCRAAFYWPPAVTIAIGVPSQIVEFCSKGCRSAWERAWVLDGGDLEDGDWRQHETPDHWTADDGGILW